MDNGYKASEQPRKKRGRPPGARKALPASAHISAQHHNGQTIALAEQTSAGDKQHFPITEPRLSSLSKLLHSILRHDRAEITRLAKEIEVTENTIYRWMNGSSEPRPAHLKRLPEVLPEHRAALIYAINQAFPGLLDMALIGVREVPKEIYQRVAELIAANEEEEACFWQVSQAIFERALVHLDAERRGLAITYARLMPAREDSVHSLREFMMRGNAPWSFNNEAKVYLGSTTLAGTAAMLQRVQIWSDMEEGRLQVEADEFERSACAAPLLRGSRIAGVLIISSARSDFFIDPTAYQAVNDYAQLLATALRDREFYPISQLNLRPMADLTIQRDYIARTYINRILMYVRKHNISRREAEQHVQFEMEQEFEEWGRLSTAEQRQKANQG